MREKRKEELMWFSYVFVWVSNLLTSQVEILEMS